MNLIRYAFVATLAALLTAGCAGDADNAGPTTAQESSTPATAPDPAGVPSPGEPSRTQVPEQLSASHILIMHQGSDRVPPGITRSKEEALALAQEVAQKAQGPGADFAALAKEYSEGPSGPAGGHLGNFRPEQMVRPFSEATLRLDIGEISDPLETQFGYHIIRREEVEEVPTVSAKHILVMYEGSMRAPPEIDRTKEEALQRIQEVQKRLKEGEEFEKLAREYSDGPTGPRGGDLGEFPKGMMAPTFDEAVFTTEVGDYSDVVETPFGYHIIYRYK